MKPAKDELLIHLILISIMMIMLPSLQFTCCNADNGVLCHQDEKQALLTLKHSSENSSVASPLSSWRDEVDCCSWEGVFCNSNTGNVVELNLANSYLTGELDNSLFMNLTQLKRLDLHDNQFRGSLPSAANFTKLQYFDISNNSFTSTIPDWLYQCKFLKHLSAHRNSLQGSISHSIANLTSLNYLHLSHNMLSGEIPSGISKLCIQQVRLSYNNLEGDISNAFGNMSDCFLQTLQRLYLNHNQLSGNLTHQFVEFNRLEDLHLRQNRLSGPLPSNLGKLVFLKLLDLSINKFTGYLPESMGQLFNLEKFNIGKNTFEGDVSETHFANLTRLIRFTASGNRLTLNVSDDWIPNFNLEILELGSWNLGAEGGIPKWLHTQQSSIQSLDLSNSGIADPIPSWFWNVEDLDLSHNKLRGNFDDVVITNSRRIDLSSNLFYGPLPRINATYVDVLDLSNNSFSGSVEDFLCHQTTENYSLEIVDLSQNLLTGELPDCFMKFPSLAVLSLADNNISGSIPESIGNLESMESLNLFKNRLSGNIPSSMRNCTKLWKIDLSSNQLIGEIPEWMGTNLPSLNFLILRSNKFGGKISSSICYLSNLRILDLSDNKFSGTIPRCIDNFTAMASSEWIIPFHKNPFDNFELHESAILTTKGETLHYGSILSLVTNIDLSSNNLSGDIPKQLTRLAQLRSLNLSRNHLNGKIPDGIEDMKMLESLDLSNNILSGKIPHGIAVVSSLSYLDLSYNNLSGEIPQGTQILTFNASSFVGNQLCGPPLTSKCGDGTNDYEDGESEVGWLYVFLSVGYVVGLAITCNVLIFKKSWSDAFFERVDNMWNKNIYVRL